MENQPLYNSRIVSNFAEYLRSARPDVDVRDLLFRSGIHPYEIEDEGHWLTQRQVDAFHDVLMDMAGDASLFREAGRYTLLSKSIQSVRQFIIGFVTPIQAYMMLGKVAAYLNRGLTFEARKVSRNSVEIVSAPHAGVSVKPYQCENSKGTFEAVAELFCRRRPVLEHPECIHRGDDRCRYILSWQEPGYMTWRRISSFIGIGSVVAVIASLFLFSPAQVLPFAFLLVLLVGGTAWYTQYLEKKDISEKLEIQGDAAGRLLDQITIGYNNALLVQEIGQAVSSILDVEKLLDFVMETLQRRLGFDRGMIMLATPDKTRLAYASGYGYSPELESYLRKTRFRLDNPNSRGPFVVAFKEQKPFLIDDAKALEGDVSVRSSDFIRYFGVRSFICVPIICEGESEGILAVDNYATGQSHSQSEVSLLMGIAQQVAVSISSARSVTQIVESEERFRTLSENTPDIVYTIDTNGALTYINPAATDILNYSREELLGRTLLEFSEPDGVAALARLYQRVWQGREIVKNVDVRLLTRTGKEKLFYMSGAPNFNARGEITGVVGTLRDFTEQRQLERQLHHAERMNAIGRLTGGISHDFNNILQAITAYTQLLAHDKKDDDPDWKYLSGINDLTKRATDLVGQLLVFSRKTESRLVPVDINREISGLYDLLNNTIPKSIELVLDLCDGICLINGDSAQLGQVIMNLTVNARDAMPRGGTLTFRTRAVAFQEPSSRDSVMIEAGRYHVMQIADTGGGIEAENLEHIFEPFFTTRDSEGGTGIGLSVVYGIVKNHNGLIFCSSVPGEGTVFELLFPALGADTTVLSDEDGRERPVQGSAGKRETILLVDDEVSLLETGRELLSLAGFDVLTAPSGEQALAIVEDMRGTIALVVLDLMMPGMSGEECLAKIRALVPSMPVIVASGYAGAIQREDVMRQGAVEFLQKPYPVDLLSAMIRTILDGRS